MLQLDKLKYASCMGALLLLTGGAHSRPYDQVSSSGGTATGGARDFHPNQIARPDEGLLMHCNVTGPCVIGRTAGQTSGSSLRQRQDIQCVLVAPEAPVRSQFQQNLTHAALMHKPGQAFGTHRPCNTAKPGLGLAGFECMMLALLAVSFPVMLWRRSMAQ
ncbi:TPA: hypothetical protein ACH3X1_005343 [Trebouxia sp. C0004]